MKWIRVRIKKVEKEGGKINPIFGWAPRGGRAHPLNDYSPNMIVAVIRNSVMFLVLPMKCLSSPAV